MTVLNKQESRLGFSKTGASTKSIGSSLLSQNCTFCKSNPPITNTFYTIAKSKTECLNHQEVESLFQSLSPSPIICLTGQIQIFAGFNDPFQRIQSSFCVNSLHLNGKPGLLGYLSLHVSLVNRCNK